MAQHATEYQYNFNQAEDMTEDQSDSMTNNGDMSEDSEDMTSDNGDLPDEVDDIEGNGLEITSNIDLVNETFDSFTGDGIAMLESDVEVSLFEVEAIDNSDYGFEVRVIQLAMLTLRLKNLP